MELSNIYTVFIANNSIFLLPNILFSCCIKIDGCDDDDDEEKKKMSFLLT